MTRGSSAGDKTITPEDRAAGLSPSQLLRRIQALFNQLKIFDRKLSLEHEGVNYYIVCDEQTFMVYRIIDAEGLPHGLPGWPVCLVTHESIIDENSAPVIEPDHFAGPGSIADWLKIIEAHFTPAS